MLSAAVFLCLVGCAPQEQGALAKKPTTTVVSGDTLANGLPRTLLPALASWTTTWKTADARFSPTAMTHAPSAGFLFPTAWRGAGRKTQGVRARALVDVLAPDSARSLDFDMYLGFDRDAQGKILLEREPDSAPILADFPRDTLWEVSFCGTDCFYDGAYWADRKRFALSGATREGGLASGRWQAFLEVYDLESRRHTLWLAAPVDSAAFERYQAASDSALIDRLEKAGFGSEGNTEARSRIAF